MDDILRMGYEQLVLLVAPKHWAAILMAIDLMRDGPRFQQGYSLANAVITASERFELGEHEQAIVQIMVERITEGDVA
jgi:hypothetical protein